MAFSIKVSPILPGLPAIIRRPGLRPGKRGMSGPTGKIPPLLDSTSSLVIRIDPMPSNLRLIN